MHGVATKRAVFLVGVIGSLLMANVAVADPLTLTFSTGGAGSSGGIFIYSGTIANGWDIAIGALTVAGDGGYDGTYDVIGNVDGSVESDVGNLTFNESANTVTIVGGVTCAGLSAPTLACSAEDIANGKVLAPDGSTLLQGTGPFSNVQNTGTATVQFLAPDIKDATLLANLAIAPNQWDLADVDIAPGSGNNFLVASATVVNTHLPEPASVLLFGTVLLGVTHMLRRRNRKT